MNENDKTQQQMKTKQTSSEFSAFRHILKILLIAILGFGFLLRLFLAFNGIQQKYKLYMNDRLEGEILRSDGSIDQFTGNTFPAVKLGDKLTLTVEHPLENPYGLGADLCFFVTSSNVEVFCGEEQVYQQDESLIEQGIMPCDQFYVVSLVPDYAEKPLIIEIVPVDRTSFTSIDLWLSPGGHASKNLLAGKEMAFLLLITMTIVSGFVMVLLTVLSISRKQFNPTVLMACFCFLIVLWNLGSQGFLYILSDSLAASHGEYAALYLACVPLSRYMVCNLQNRILKTIMKGFALFFTGFFVYTTIITFTSVPASYATVLPVLHGAILLMMVTYFISIYVERGVKRGFAQQIAEIGFRICIVIGMLEFLRFNFVNNFGTSVPFLRHSLGAIAIAELVMTMILSAGYTYASDLLEKMEKEQLRRLAYEDSLTGIPNRSACYRNLDDLTARKVKQYSMMFFDLNFLKKANDTYGHDVGDQMLNLTAETLKKVFEDRGFYGRWGGDEFIACVTGGKEKGDAALAAFRKEVEAVNRNNRDLPYGLSIAIGRMDSTEEHPLDPIEALNAADDRMYEEKKRMKALRED